MKKRYVVSTIVEVNVFKDKEPNEMELLKLIKGMSLTDLSNNSEIEPFEHPLIDDFADETEDLHP